MQSRRHKVLIIIKRKIVGAGGIFFRVSGKVNVFKRAVSGVSLSWTVQTKYLQVRGNPVVETKPKCFG